VTLIFVNLSPYHKTLKFSLDEIEYDISNEIPESVWNIGNRNFPLHPIYDWELRKRAREIFIKYFKENIDSTMDENEIVF
jgi:hypothetical protein